MIRRLAIVFAVILTCPIAAGNAETKTRQLSCSGIKIEPTAMAQSPMTAQLTLVTPRKTTVNLGTGDISGPVVSDNRITLRFRTKDFTGEFFHYTNDLFLIYHSGHLAKLTCTPG